MQEHEIYEKKATSSSDVTGKQLLAEGRNFLALQRSDGRFCMVLWGQYQRGVDTDFLLSFPTHAQKHPVFLRWTAVACFAAVGACDHPA